MMFKSKKKRNKATGRTKRNVLKTIVDQPVYHRRRIVGRRVIRISVNSPVSAFELELIIYGGCQDHDDDRVLGYDSAHDEKHQIAFGNCHYHRCQERGSFSPCDYDSIWNVFAGESVKLLAEFGYA